MKEIIFNKIRRLVRCCGVDIVSCSSDLKSRKSYSDFSDRNVEIFNLCKKYTMTSPERINALIEAINYIVMNKIDGDMVECGVWKGGSAMAMMLALKEFTDEDRDIYLYDTFSGMTSPSSDDISLQGEDAQEIFQKYKNTHGTSNWCCSSLKEVKDNVYRTGYRKEKIHFIPGKVEETIPNNTPSKIALLRLDTDWYESTKHELTYLFDKIQKNGVLIIDDYGHWKGSRKAVDEYISDNNICIFLNRIDYTGRIGIKVE